MKTPEGQFIDFLNDLKKRPRRDILLPDSDYYEMLEKSIDKASRPEKSVQDESGDPPR